MIHVVITTFIFKQKECVSHSLEIKNLWNRLKNTDRDCNCKHLTIPLKKAEAKRDFSWLETTQVKNADRKEDNEKGDGKFKREN